jgi:lambda family phage tail tape measure protein
MPAMISITKAMVDATKPGSLLNTAFQTMKDLLKDLAPLLEPLKVSFDRLGAAFNITGGILTAGLEAWDDIFNGKVPGWGAIFTKLGDTIKDAVDPIPSLVKPVNQGLEDVAASLRKLDQAMVLVKDKSPLDKLIQQTQDEQRYAQELYTASLQGAQAYAKALADVSFQKASQKALDDGAPDSVAAAAIAKRAANTEDLGKKIAANLAIQKATNDLIVQTSSLIENNSEVAKVNAQIKAGMYAAASVGERAALQAAAANKDAATQDQKGKNILIGLQEQINSLTSNQTALEKAKADIIKAGLVGTEKAKEIEADAKIVDLTRQTNELAKQKASLDAEAAKNDQALQAQLNTLTMGNVQAEEANKKAAMAIQYEKQMNELLANHNHTQAEINNLTDSYNASLAQVATSTQQIAAAEGSWMNGMTVGLQNWANTTANVNSQMSSLVNTTMNSMTDAIVQFVNTGKINFKSLVVSFLEGVEKMIIQQQILLAIEELTGTAGSGSAGSGAGSGAGNVGGTMVGNHAFGSAWGGGRQFFGAGGVVDGPTNFNMGTMGEAGPEAILPLTRGSNGQLGVQAVGGGNGGGNTVVVQTPITINFQGDAGNPADQAKLQNNLQSQVKATVLQVLRDQSRSGGILNPTNVSA